jgi:hypothetical protein
LKSSIKIAPNCSKISQSSQDAGFGEKSKLADSLNRPNLFASPGHDLVYFDKKYQLPPVLVQKGFKKVKMCNKIGF